MKHILLAFALSTAFTQTACAQGITSAVDTGKTPAFNITSATATTDGRLTTFMMEVAGVAGSVTPVATGQLNGSKIESYVWPTSLDPSKVGFDPKSGILAMAITAHPDFDDTPLYDEDLDGDPANDGKYWHSHWIVLNEDNSCPGGLKIRDVSPGVDLLPETAPMLPIALDSPGMTPLLSGRKAKVTVPLSKSENVSFDAVTAVLQVDESSDTPLVCVTGVHDVASGDLSMPGRVRKARK